MIELRHQVGLRQDALGRRGLPIPCKLEHHRLAVVGRATEVHRRATTGSQDPQNLVTHTRLALGLVEERGCVSFGGPGGRKNLRPSARVGLGDEAEALEDPAIEAVLRIVVVVGTSNCDAHVLTLDTLEDRCCHQLIEQPR